MTERDLLILIAAQFYRPVAGTSLEALVEQNLARAREYLAAANKSLATASPEQPDARPAQPVKLENPLTAPAGVVISPPITIQDPKPPVQPPLSGATTKPKNPASIPAPVPPFTEYDANCFACTNCNEDKLRIRIPREGRQSRAECQTCGFIEEFELNDDDRDLVMSAGTFAEGSIAAKKAQAVVEAKKPPQPKSTVVTDKKTGQKSLVTKFINEEGDPCTSIKVLLDEDPDQAMLPFAQPRNQSPSPITSPCEQKTPAVSTTDKPNGTPTTISASKKSSTESLNEPPRNSPEISELVKSIVGYEPPPVNLDAARIEMTLIVAEWTTAKRLERYEKLFSAPWASVPDDPKLIDALVNASLGRIVAE